MFEVFRCARKANGPVVRLGHSAGDQARRVLDNAGPLNLHSPTRRSTGVPDALTSAQHVLGLSVYLYQCCCVLILAIPWPGRGRSFPAAMLAGVAAETVETARAPLVTKPTQKRAGLDSGSPVRPALVGRIGRP